jgi:hypothetical protein
MNRLFTSILPVILALVAGTASAAEKIWTGSSGSNWSTPANWQPAGTPTQSDDVVFDGTISSISCSLPSNVIVRNLSVLPNYTGTITGVNQASAILTVLQELHLSGGTISTGLSKLKVAGRLWVDGGTLTKGAGGICSLMNVKIDGGSVTIGNSTVEVLGDMEITGGSFQTGSGTFMVAVSYVQSGGTYTKTAGVGTFIPSGALSITGGTFNCQAAAISFKTLQLSNAILNGGTSSIYMNGNTSIDNSTFNKTSGAVYMNNNASFTANNSTIDFGTSAFNAHALTIQGGSFNLGSGSLVVVGVCSFNGATITKASGSSNFALTQTLTISGGSVSFGTGLVNSGALHLSNGDLRFGSGVLNLAGVLTIEGTSSFRKNAGVALLSLGSNVNFVSGTVDFAGSTQVQTGNWIQSSGIATTGSCSMLVNGNFELSNDAEFTAPTSLLDVKGNFRRISGTFNNGNGTVRMSGTSSIPYNILGNPFFNNLEFYNTSGVNNKTIEVYGTISVNGDLLLTNASAANRALRINTGTISIYGNLNIANYRCTEVNPGTATLRFTGGSTQTISGVSLTDGVGILPSIHVDKTGGIFQLFGNVNFGNGFSHQNSTIEFDPEMVFGMAGGNFYLEGLLLPIIHVTGLANLTSSVAVIGNLEILSNGFLINGSDALNVNSELINRGRYQNMSGSLNVSGVLSNRGEFSVNSGSMNALSGIIQELGVFTCGTGQVNTIGTLSINNGSFNCAAGMVVVSGSINQNGGILNGNTSGGSLVISQNFNQNSGIFHGQTGTMSIGSSLNMNGTFVRGAGTVNFNGFGPQTVPALFYNKLSIAGSGRLITLAPGEIRIGASTGGFNPHASNLYTTINNTINYSNNGNQDITGFIYNNLTVSRNGTKTITANTSVKSTLEVLNSAVLDADGANNNRVMTLLSSQSLTARIERIPATASITGNMTVQRWTRGGIRSNRFFGSPVDTVGGIKFRQVKDNILLYGPGNGSNGWDNPTVFNTNIFVYSEPILNGFEWRSPASTNEVLPKGAGFLVYHVGDRSQVNLQVNTIPNAAIIDFKGNPNQGDIALPITCTGGCLPVDNGNGWNLVANPYASPIDWDSPEWTKAGISSTIYIWNPRINQYASYNTSNPGAATNGGSRYIGPGQGFFMKVTENNPSLIAHESIKTSQFPDTLLFRIGAAQSQLRLLISKQESEVQDEAVLEFRQEATEDFDPAIDAHKPELPGMTLSFGLMNENGDALSVHALPKPNIAGSDKIIPIRLKGDVGSYSIQASQLESFDSDVVFYLEDRLMKTIVKVEEGKSYPVEITNDPATSSNGRLNLILRHNRANSIAGSDMRVFPNPSNGSNVQVVLPKASRGTLEVYDMLGAKLVAKNIENAQQTIQLDAFDTLAAGTYTLVWTSSEGRYSELLTVK